jgi:hypothetical protein
MRAYGLIWRMRASTRGELIARNQIGLVEQHDIGKGKLFLRFVRSIELAQEMLGVNNCYDRIELGFATDVLIRQRRSARPGPDLQGLWFRPSIPSKVPFRRSSPPSMRLPV